MKKNLYKATLLLGLAFLSGSCMEGDIDFTQYDEYASVLSFSYNGLLEIDYNNIGRDVEVKVQGEEQEELLKIRKGGTDSSRSAVAQLVLMTQAELDAYNEENGSTYQFLPEEFYTMPKELTIGSDTDGCLLNIVLKASLGEDAEAHKNQIIPIKLKSETSQVNEYNNTLVIAPKIITPSVSLDAVGIQTVNMYDFTTAVEEECYTTGISLDFFNEWEFIVKLIDDNDRLKELVNTYNLNNGTDFALLSQENYTMPSSVEFNSNESSKDFSVVLNRKGLAVGKYLLPVVLDKVEGMPFEINGHVLYICLNLTRELPRVPVSMNQVSANSSEENGTPRSAFDNNIQTFWKSQSKPYDGYTEPVNDPVYGVYLDVDFSLTNIRLNTLLNFIVDVRGWDRATLPYKVRLFGGTGKDDMMPLSDEIVIELAEQPTKQTVFENPTAVALPESGINYVRFSILESIDKTKSKIYKLTEKKNSDGSWNWGSVSIVELRYYGL